MKKNRKWYLPSFELVMPRKLLLIMRISFILLFAILIQVSANGLAQKVNIKQSKLTYEQLFDEIETQTGIATLLSNRELNLQDEIVIRNDTYELEQLLKEVTSDTNLTFELIDDYVIIRPLTSREKIMKSQAQQPEEKKIIIKGTVEDESGQPIPFVAVKFKGTTIGSMSAADGTYELEAPEEEGLVLEISSLGFVTQEIPVDGRTTIDIVLQSDMMGLDEVVVTGYQTISPERATGSYKNINITSLSEQKTSSNVIEILEGEIPGLLFEEGSFGNSPTITLRGHNNLNGDDDPNSVAPLIVLDGFELNGQSSDDRSNYAYDIIEKINPNDIESITVLKDAAAASIWGAKAANGVIVISTKRGKSKGAPVVNFNSSFSIKSKPDYHQANMASVETLLDVDKYAVNNGVVWAPWAYNPNPNTSRGRQVYYDLAQGQLTQNEADAIINGLLQNDMVDEYSDAFLRAYTQQQYSLSLSQAEEAFSYYASFNYTDEKTSLLGADNKQYSTMLKLSADIAKGVRLSSQLQYSKQDINNNSPADIIMIPRYNQFYDDEGNYMPGRYSLYYDNSLNQSEYYFPYSYDYNEMQEFKNKDNTSEVRNTGFQTKLDIDIYKGLKAELSYNYQYGKFSNENFMNEELYLTRSFINNAGIYDLIPGENWWDPSIVKFNRLGIPEGNILERQYSVNSSNAYRGLLNYTNYIDKNGKHFITAIAGMEYSRHYFEAVPMATLYAYDPQVLSSTPVDLANNYTQWHGYESKLAYPVKDMTKREDRFLSTFTNIGYTYNNKYTLTGSWRLDDSNLFGSSPKYRNVPLWSTGIKWRMSDEEFINAGFLDQLDLRVSYGTGGNINKSVSPLLTFKKANDIDTQHPYAAVQDYENQELRWEKTSTLNIGIDFTLFNKRLNGMFEYYNKYSSDVMGEMSMNPTYGIKSQYRNYAEISNIGFDSYLAYQILLKTDVKWNASLILSHNKNRIEEYDGASNIDHYVRGGHVKGNDVTGFYCYNWAGLSNTGAPQVYDENGDIVAHTEDISNIDALSFSGQLSPKYFGSLRNSFHYNNLSLDILLSYKLGHKFRRVSAETFSVASTMNLHKDFEDRWMEEGDENITDVPALTSNIFGNYGTYYTYSNALVEDASHIRVKSISLNYRLKEQWLKNNFLKSVTIGANVRDLGLLWKATKYDIDPDYNAYVGQAKNRPMYSINLKANF